jgi:spore germination protein YaaH
MKRWSIIIIVVAIVLSGLLFGIRYFDQPEEIEEFQLRIDGELIPDAETILQNGELYVSHSQIRSIPGLVSFQEGERVHIFSVDRQTMLTIESDQVVINREPYGQNAGFLSNGEFYLSAKIVQDALGTPINWSAVKLGATLQSGSVSYAEYHVNGTLRLRTEPSSLASVVDILTPMSRVFVYERTLLDKEDWIFVVTASGREGYLQKKQVSLYENIDPIQRANKEFYEPILLAWDYFSENTTLTYKLEPGIGLNVLSPTWFSLQKEEGNFTILDMGNETYRKWAAQRGYAIWGLFKNAFDPDWTKEMLRNPKQRLAVEEEIIRLAKAYRLEGINLDFENIYEEDRDYLSQFVRELFIMTREADLFLSMDVTRPGGSPNWSLCYDRRELANALDYIFLMAYEEYYAGGGESGPVASLPWTEESIQMMLEEVPAEQLVLGIPLYVRRWQEPLTGTGKARSKALTLNGVQNIIDERELTPVWDPGARQFKVSYEDEEGTYQIWLEDALSMYQRVQLIHEYQLAGFGAWRKGFETDSTWNNLYGFLSMGK